MNYQELRDYALQRAMEHHLCNIDDLLAEGKTLDEIMAMIDGDDYDTTVFADEPYEHYEADSLVGAIEDMRGVNVYNFMHVLTQVNGQEWAIDFKGKA